MLRCVPRPQHVHLNQALNDAMKVRLVRFLPERGGKETLAGEGGGSCCGRQLPAKAREGLVIAVLSLFVAENNRCHERSSLKKKR